MKLDKITSIRLFQGDGDKLQTVAKLEGLDKSDVIRRAVKLYLDEYESHPFATLTK